MSEKKPARQSFLAIVILLVFGLVCFLFWLYTRQVVTNYFKYLGFVAGLVVGAYKELFKRDDETKKLKLQPLSHWVLPLLGVCGVCICGVSGEFSDARRNRQEAIKQRLTREAEEAKSEVNNEKLRRQVAELHAQLAEQRSLQVIADARARVRAIQQHEETKRLRSEQKISATRHEGMAIANHIDEVSKTLTGFKQTARGFQQTAQGFRKTADYMTGGNSYCFLRFVPGKNGMATVLVEHKGKFPVYDLSAEVVDFSPSHITHDINKGPGISGENYRFMIGNVRNTLLNVVGQIPCPSLGDLNYQVFLSARNGNFSEVARGTCDEKGEWRMSIKVTNSDPSAEGGILHEENYSETERAKTSINIRVPEYPDKTP